MISQRMRILASAPLWTAIALYAVASESWGIALAVSALVVVAIAYGPRWDAARSGQLLVGVVSTVGVYAAQSILGDVEAGVRVPLPPPVEGLAVSALLNAAVRLIFARPLGGPRVTYALVLLAVLTCGLTPHVEVYVVAVGISVLTTLWSLRGLDPGRPTWAELTTKNRVVSFALPFGAVALALAVALPLPPAARRMKDEIERAVAHRYAQRIGFSDNIRLGQVTRLTASDRVALRLEGPRTDYLRGVVFNGYSTPDGMWDDGYAGTATDVEVVRGRPPGERVVEVRRVNVSKDRLFVPLGVRALGTRSGHAKREPKGAWQIETADRAAPTWFALGEDAYPPVPPGRAETVLPTRIAPEIVRIAREWTAGIEAPDAKMAALAARLERDYEYALERAPAPRGKDPIVDFLTRTPSGHCEYFASALALLGRGAGVATRVVAGYRVAEKAPLRGYWVVRDRNAHAWVEAFIPDVGWRTYDATPAAALPQNQEHEGSWARTMLDSVADAFDAAREYLLARTAGQLWGGAFVAVLALAAFQMWRGARGRLLARGKRGSGTPAHVVRLVAAVAHTGGPARDAWEPLETYARALAREPRYARAADLLAAWAAFRYGGIGDGARLARDMDAAAGELRRAGASEEQRRA